MEYFVITFQQILELFLLILLGYFCSRTGVAAESAKKSFSGLLINIVLPAVILHSFQTVAESAGGESLIEAFLLSVFAHLLLILLSFLFIRKRADGTHRLLRLCTAYSNAGFMGIPLLWALFGETGSFYASVYVTVFHLFLWTAGIYSLSGKSDFSSLKKQLVSPTLLSVFLSVVLYLFGITLPEILLKPVSYLADMNTPFAMIVTGISLASCEFQKVFRTKAVYYAGFLKLLLLPLCLFLIFSLCGIRGDAAVCVLLLAACPTAAVVPMVALSYDQDEALASGVFSLSTVFCIFSIPLLMLVM